MPSVGWILISLTVIGLSGCASERGRTGTSSGMQTANPLSNSGIIWARKDGRRMSGNATLFEQGQRDKQSCELTASQTGILDFSIFSTCMDEKGYYRRDLAT
jgi:hypothetical protein